MIINAARLGNIARRICAELLAAGYPLPEDLRGWVETGADRTKTVAYFDRVLNGAVLGLYRGDIGREEFVDELFRLLDEQYRRAWNEGMRENDLDPQRDMKPEWEAVLQDAIAGQLDYVEPFADAILAAKEAGTPVGPLQSRVSLWSNGYNAIVQLSIITTRPDDRYRWEVGPTEHCSTCEALNGIVATAKDWQESGYAPQGRMLECGGYRCQCRWVYTEDPVTPGGIPAGL